MTQSQKLQLRLSEIRARLAELAGKDSLSEDETAESRRLTTEFADTETRAAAAMVAESAEAEQAAADDDAPDAEQRERIELRARCRVSNFLTAAARGRLVNGAEAELCEAAAVDGIPLELFEPTPEQRAAERERRAATEAPGTVGVNLDPIVPAVFAASIAPRLGIEMPQVPSGTYATGTVTGSQSAAGLAKGADAVAVAGAIRVQTATPKRISARLELQLEDIAAVGADNFEAVLRQNLSLALSDELDRQAITGDGSGADLTGIMTRLGAPAPPGAGVATFDSLVALFAGGIDGLWAPTIGDVAIVAGVASYALSARTFRDASGSDLGEVSFADYARAHFAGWWTNKRMPAPVNNVQPAILYRSGRGAMPMVARTAVCPTWASIGIDDIYSGSASGLRSFTLHVLCGDVLLVQPDAYAPAAVRVAVNN